MQLRPYQTDAVNSIFEYFGEKRGNPCLALPCGVGKSLVIADFVKKVLSYWPSQRILMLAHVKELVSQDVDKLLKIWPDAPLGIYSAGLGKKESFAPIVYGGIDSVVHNIEDIGFRDLVIVDEAQRISTKDSSNYQKVFAKLREINPKMKVIGLTATPYRLGQGMITDDGLFDDICFDLTRLEAFNQLIKDGYLCPLIPKRTTTQLDVSSVGISNGDYKQNELQKAVDVNEITYRAIQEVLEQGADRQCWMFFASGVEHAEHITECLQSFGISAVCVHSKMPTKQRDENIRDFKAGIHRAIVGNNVLTTGFDHPPIDLIAFLRPTTSPGLWVQCLGRGTRPCQGKENCILEGELVLTDHGLVPIEKVSLDMKVWDGHSWVVHCGAVFRGEQDVIEYAGLRATPDHRVWTKKGWKTFRESFEGSEYISKTGSGGKEIRETDNHFTRDCKEKGLRESVYSHKVRLRIGSFKRFNKCDKTESRMSNLWSSSQSPEMVKQSNYFSKTKMHKSERFSILQLWCKGNPIQIQITFGNGVIHYGKFWFRSNKTNRQDRQQRSLRTRKFEIINTKPKSIPYQKRAAKRNVTQIQRTLSAHKICRFYFTKVFFNGVYVRRRFESMGKTLIQTKGRVWDILNAGPLHRFTVSGLLVSNCLVLDFSGNTARLGPINDPVIPKKRGKSAPGEVPVKLCPQCGIYYHSSVRTCSACGYEFPRYTKLQTQASEAELIKTLEPEIRFYDIDRTIYAKHQKPGAPASLRVTYFSGIKKFEEYVCLEHQGFARKKAADWWLKRISEKIPSCVDEALSYISELRKVRRIEVIVNRKYPEIINHEF